MGCCQILAVVVFEEAVESQHACEHEEEKEEEEEERERGYRIRESVLDCQSRTHVFKPDNITEVSQISTHYGLYSTMLNLDTIKAFLSSCTVTKTMKTTAHKP